MEAKPAPVVLPGLEPQPGRTFTEVAYSREDLSHLRIIAADLVSLIEWRTPEEGANGYRSEGRDEGSRWQHVVVRWEELMEAGFVFAVGFCGIQREDSPREELDEADQALIREFPGQPHILSYSTRQRGQGRFDNLVCFRSVDGLDDWRENEVHAEVVARLARRSYQHVRLHRGELVEGLRGATPLRLLRTGFYDYTGEETWVGVREYPEPLA